MRMQHFVHGVRRSINGWILPVMRPHYVGRRPTARTGSRGDGGPATPPPIDMR